MIDDYVEIKTTKKIVHVAVFTSQLRLKRALFVDIIYYYRRRQILLIRDINYFKQALLVGVGISFIS